MALIEFWSMYTIFIWSKQHSHKLNTISILYFYCDDIELKQPKLSGEDPHYQQHLTDESGNLFNTTNTTYKKPRMCSITSLSS